MFKRKFIPFFILLALCAGLVSPALADGADGTVVTISSTEAFLEFAQNCSLDAWSQGMSFSLTCDLDLSGTDFRSIPTFGGVLDGNGHTIRGILFTDEGSIEGLFRYIQAGALVRNLNVAGVYRPGGTRSTIGGIAGENYGTITNCSFTGTVVGDTHVGGIAGLNGATGVISNCSSHGKVYGEHYVGGVAGKNMGTILLTTNLAYVNTSLQKTTSDLEDLSLSSLETIGSEAVADISDIGGIAGHSTGLIQSCTNVGCVGYTHVGYNVGGIAGRQSGYINGCVNQGQVLGRKDIGGIAGQVEPYSVWQLSGGDLSALQSELDTLQSLINRTLSNASANSSAISGKLDAVGNSVSRAQDVVDDMAGIAGDLVDDNLDAVNSVSARVSEALTALAPAFGDITRSAEDLRDFIDQSQQTVQYIRGMSAELDRAAEDLDKALDDLKLAAEALQTAGDHISAGMEHLKSSLGDPDAVDAALNEITGGLGDMSSALGKLNDALGNVSAAADDLKASDAWKTFTEQAQAGDASAPALAAALDDLIASGEFQDFLRTADEQLPNLIDSLRGMSDALSKIQSGLNVLAENFDLEEFKSALDAFGQAADAMSRAFDALGSAAGHLSDASPYLHAARDDADAALDAFSDSLPTLKEAMDQMASAFNGIAKLAKDLADKPQISFTPADDRFTETREQLSDALRDVSGGLSELNAVVSGGSQMLIGDLQAVSDQLFVVFDLLIDLTRNVGNGLDGDNTEDISTEDAENATEGIVSQCSNLGAVDGDVNVGGIAGAMAVEYDFDPEDDYSLTDKVTGGTKYARAVIRNCGNSGDVTCKKSYTGGIVGRMDFGYVTACHAVGEIRSTGGGYVGGIAGSSQSVIQNCSAKCRLSGRNYVGGIAGYGTDLSGNYALADITEAGEFFGSIAGKAQGSVRENYFVGATGGIDRISYVGKAEAVPYDSLSASGGSAEIFRSFTVTFMADGGVVGTATVDYGATLGADEVPQIPEKDGCYGKWDMEALTNITSDKKLEAEYVRFLSALSSEQERGQNRSVLLADGVFSEDAVLTLVASGTQFAPASGNVLEVWDAVIENGTQDGYTLRYLAPDEDPNGVSIYIRSGDAWRKADTEIVGNYILFHTPSDEAVFAAVQEKDPTTLLLSCVAALVLLIILLVLYKKKRTSKKRASAKKPHSMKS